MWRHGNNGPINKNNTSRAHDVQQQVSALRSVMNLSAANLVMSSYKLYANVTIIQRKEASV